MLRESFQISGYRPELIPLKGRERKLAENEHGLDCVSTVNEQSSVLKGVGGFFSDVVVAYQDVVITLKSHQEEEGFRIDRIEDLRGRVIESFRGAQSHLGITDIVGDNPLYHEHSGKASQIVLLYRERIDALIMDERIFYYFLRKVRSLVDTDQPVNIHHVFTAVPYKVFCLTQPHRDAVSRGLADLHSNGRYQEIIDGYLR